MTKHSRWIALACVLALGLAPLAGCGSDSGDGGGSGPGDDRAQLEQGAATLGQFGANAFNEPGTQMLLSPQVSSLNEGLLPGLGGTLLRGLNTEPGPMTTMRQIGRTPGDLTRLAASMGSLPTFGTYSYDELDQTEPFYGWVLSNPGSPSDGYIFSFGLQDGFSYFDDQGAEHPLRGEIRYLGITVDDRGTPSDDSDDLLTHVTYEMAASGDASGPLTTFFRFDITLEYDGTGEVVSLAVGDFQASSPGAGGTVSYIGSMLFAVLLDASTEGELDARLQVFDSAENFALAFSLLASGWDPVEGIPTSADFSFGFGATGQPSSPPWVIAFTADNFRDDPANEGPDYDLADIDGDIRFNNSVVATFAGTTQEVPVDTDGDGVDDDFCADVDLCFADAPEECVNICVVFGSIDSVLGGVALGAAAALY